MTPLRAAANLAYGCIALTAIAVLVVAVAPIAGVLWVARAVLQQSEGSAAR